MKEEIAANFQHSSRIVALKASIFVDIDITRLPKILRREDSTVPCIIDCLKVQTTLRLEENLKL